MLHQTPVRFGGANAQAVMGFQMAVAYVGSMLMPPLFGFIASATSLALLPWFLAGCTAVLLLASERLRSLVHGQTPHRYP
jgi:hypothetical protein